MSTAGKVLTVLILLVMVVWIVMLSGVSQLNANYGQKIQREQADLEKVTADAVKANADYLSTTEKARLEQDLTESELRLKLADIASAERRRTTSVEALTRVTLQLEGCQRDVEVAKKNLEIRDAEKVKAEELLAKKREEIARLQATNAESKAQLAQLQEDFKKLLAENAARIKSPGAKPASNRREGPSS